VDPVLGREVVEGEQIVPVLLQAFAGGREPGFVEADVVYQKDTLFLLIHNFIRLYLEYSED
jgi:hypothetical protein